MTTVKFERDHRKYFTFHGLLPEAVLQLKEYSMGDRDIADGDGMLSLVERKVCNDTGKFKIDRLEAQSVVTAAYAEGWHEKY